MKKIYFLITIILMSSIYAGYIQAQEVIVTDDETYTVPAGGAILDVKSTSMGFMAPRVELTATNAASPLTLPSTGLLVYNTTTTSLTGDDEIYNVTPGFYYNAGSPSDPDWVQVVNATGVGTANVWDDLRVPLSEPSTGNIAPEWDEFPYGSSGSYPFLNWFKASGVDEMYFVVQLPHDWDEGTDIYPHIHWVPSEAGSGAVVWGLQYSWLNIGETHTSYTTITGSSAVPSETFVANRQYLTPLGTGAMDGEGKLISSMIICRIYRDGNNGSDTYSGLAGALEIDFHYQRNSMGSRLEYTK